MGRPLLFVLGLGALSVSVCVATLLMLALLPLPLPGWTTTAVLSDSMGPVIRAGDAVVVREDIPAGDVSVPTVVLVERPGQDPLLHRIVERRPGGQYVTRGDANADSDSTPVAPEHVKGAGRLVVPWVGTPAQWAREGRIVELLVLSVTLTGLVLLSRFGLGASHDPWARPASAAAPPHGRRPRRRGKALALGVGTVLTVTTLHSDSPWLAQAAFSDAAEYAGQHFAADELKSPTSITAAVRCVPAVNAPTVVGSRTASGTRDVTIAMPSQVQSGDLLIALMVDKNVPLTGPTGWNASTGAVWPGQMKAQLWHRVATGTDAGKSYKWKSSVVNPGAYGSVGVLAVRGAAGPWTVGDAGVTMNSGAEATVSAPNRTVSVANSLLVTLYAARKTGLSFGTPSGMSEHYNYSGTHVGAPGEDDGAVAAFTEVRPTIGGTGPRTSTLSAIARSAGLSVILKPASLPKVDLTWTPTSSTYATGHEVLRGGVSQTTLTPRGITTWTDENPGTGTRTYQVRARAGNWQSTSATASLTPVC